MGAQISRNIMSLRGSVGAQLARAVACERGRASLRAREPAVCHAANRCSSAPAPASLRRLCFDDFTRLRLVNITITVFVTDLFNIH